MDGDLPSLWRIGSAGVDGGYSARICLAMEGSGVLVFWWLANLTDRRNQLREGNMVVGKGFLKQLVFSKVLVKHLA